MGCSSSRSLRQVQNPSGVLPEQGGRASASSEKAAAELASLLDWADPPGRAISSVAPYSGSCVREEEYEESESSASDAGLSPEQQWQKQARRVERQAKRRRKAAVQAAAVLSGKGHLPGSAAEGEAVGTNAAGSLDERYTIGCRIARGSYSSVSRCSDVKTGLERALKSVDKRKTVSDDQIQEEVAVMRVLEQGQHPNIIRFFESFSDGKFVHIVMELCDGGELFSCIERVESKGFPDDIASSLTMQMAAATHHLHSRCIVHRDLKPENFMLLYPVAMEDLGKAQLKMIDFGFSRRFVPGQRMQSLACTMQYVAPEVLDANYTELCDVWSLGVSIYMLLCGAHPFPGSSEASIVAKAKSGIFETSLTQWSAASVGGRSLVESLLVVDPFRRLTAVEIVRHAWLRGAGHS